MAQPLPIRTDQSDSARAIVAERPTERRRVPRIPFRATSVVTEIESSRIVVAHTKELSRFGCSVQTMKPYPQGTKIRIEVADGLDVFTAFGAVAYVTRDGMGIVFDILESENCQILERWLSREPRRSNRHSFIASAEIKDLGSRHKQVAITRDLSAGGCYVETVRPLPKGSRLRLRIKHAGAQFTAMARVTNDASEEGMGVEFIRVKTRDRAILEKWLAGETLVDDTFTYLLVGGLFLLLAAAIAVVIIINISSR